MSQNNKITVLQIEPKKFPKVITIDNELSSLQAKVGGLIECIDITDDITLICNEEGKINGLEPNRAIRTDDGKLIDIIAGNMLIVGFDEIYGEFCSLSDEQIAKTKEMFFNPDFLFVFHDELHCINSDWQMRFASPVELNFVDANGEIKDKCTCNNEYECTKLAMFINQMYVDIADNINNSIDTLQNPIDFKTAEKLLNNAIDPFSDAWEEDVEI